MSSVCVIANPAAGKGQASAVADQVVAAAIAAGHDVTLVNPSSAAGTTAALHHAVASGVHRVIVLGGDGVVHLAVNVLAQTGVELGIIPVGTGNDSVRALGLPLDVPGAIAAALGPAHPRDGLRTDHGWGLSVATVGFSVEVNIRAASYRFPKGGARYQRATIAELPGLRTLPLTVTVDGVIHDAPTTLLAVGNGAYFGGSMQICPTAEMTDGLLDVTISGPVSRLELLRVFPRVFKGTHVDHRAVTTLRGRVVVVSGDADIWADGERLGPLPVTLEAIPNALLIAGVAA
jgi:diacylglycerol kinase (ATP)